MGRTASTFDRIAATRAGRALGVALACIALGAIACLDDRGVAPPDAPSIRLGISAQVAGPGRTVEIRVSYRHMASDGETVELVALPVRPSLVTLASGETRDVQVTIEVQSCLDDARRIGAAESPAECALVVELRLLDDGGSLLDNEVYEAPPTPPGETVTMPPVTLAAPSIVLDPTTVAFEAVAGGAIPEAETATIGNGGGGTLGTPTISLTPAGASEWLTATLNEAGQVVIRPTTTDLPPGERSASVVAEVPLASNSPQAIVVTYVVSAPAPKPLTIGGANTGSGRVTSTPPGIDCTINSGVVNGTCTATFAHGSSVTLNAAPNTGSTFGGWTGDCTSETACSVTLDQARSVTASFATIRHALTVSGGEGTGAGTVTGTGIDCVIIGGSAGGDCSETLDYGTVVVLAATPGANMEFGGWDGACSGTASCQVTLTQPAAVVASFSLLPRLLEVRLAGTGTGTVSALPGIACTNVPGAPATDCVENYPHGAMVTLAAAAGPNSVFRGWTGGGCSGTGDCAVAMTEARIVTATFAPVSRTLTTSLTGSGFGTIASGPPGIACTNIPGAPASDCAEDYEHGSQVTLTAEPASGSVFSGWSEEGCPSSSPTCAVTMNDARTVTASFSLVTHRLTVNGSGSGDGRVASDPPGIDCRISAGAATGTCQFDWPHGTTVTLTPTADANSNTSGWNGACSASGGLCTVTMTAPQTATAGFTLKSYRLTLALSGGGSGSVQMDATEGTCRFVDGVASGTCSVVVSHGTVVAITAIMDPGSGFIGWGAPCADRRSLTCTVTVNQPMTVSAMIGAFYDLDVSGDGMGAGTVTSDPSGISCTVDAEGSGGTCSASFLEGTLVRLTAAPAAGSLFAGWAGVCDGPGLCEIAIGGDDEVIATFELAPQVQVYGGGTGSGRVVSTPAGIDCTITDGVFGPGCHAFFAAGTEVTLTATPDAGSTFTRWSECGETSGPGPCVLTVTGANWVTAHFQKLIPLTVAPVPGNTGIGTVTGGGLNCTISGGTTTAGSVCTVDVVAGSTVQLLATPATGYLFSAWGAGSCTIVAGNQCSVTVSALRTVTASFVSGPYTITVRGTGDGTGRVQSSGVSPAIDCTINGSTPTGSCTQIYSAGKPVQLTATTVAGSGNRFVNWSGACTGTSPTCTPPSVPGIERIVTAQFGHNVCLERSFHTFGTSSTGVLDDNDCVSPHFDQSGSGWVRDAWDVTFAQTQVFEARLSSPSAELRVSWVPNPPGSTSSNGFEWFQRGATLATMRILAPPGTTTLQPANAAEDRFGTYTLTTLTTSADGCNPVIRTSFGVTTSAFALARPGTLADCTYTASTGAVGPADRFTIYVPSGRTLSVTVTSTGFQPLIELRDGFVDNLGTGSLIASTKGDPAGSSATLTRSGGGWMQIWVSARDGKTGDYTFTIAP